MDSDGLKRTRWRVALWIPLVIACGLLTRADVPLPGLLRTYGGDTLYAVLVYVLLAFLAPARPPLQLGVAAALACLLVELSQLLDVGWLNALRANRLGALVLGRGFVWTDLACYAVGAAVAACAELLLRYGRRDS